MVQQPDDAVSIATDERYQNAIEDLRRLERERQDIQNRIEQIDSGINLIENSIDEFLNGAFDTMSENEIIRSFSRANTPEETRAYYGGLQDRIRNLEGLYDPLLAQQEANAQARDNHPAHQMDQITDAAGNIRQVPQLFLATVVPRLNLFRAQSLQVSPRLSPRLSPRTPQGTPQLSPRTPQGSLQGSPRYDA